MIIELGELKFHFVILLISPIGYILARIIYQNYLINPYYYLFIFFLSHFLSLIPLLIYKKNEKEQNKNDKENKDINRKIIPEDLQVKNEIDILKEKLEELKKIQKIKNIAIFGILYFISFVLFYFSNYISNTTFYGNISMISEVLYFSLFNKILLGRFFYSHHCFSIILMSIGKIGLYIILMIQFIQSEEENAMRDFIIPFIIDFFLYLIFTFFLIKSKIIIEKYFISPYEMIFYLGLLGAILLLIFEPITFFIKCNNEQSLLCYKGKLGGIINGIKQLSSIKGLFASLGIMLSLFLTTLGLWMTVAYLSPSHYLTSESIGAFGLNIVNECYRNNKLLKNPLFYIFPFITIFACFIYNEILIINACNLNYNTRKSIIERQSSESNISRYTINNNIEDNLTNNS